MTLNTRFLSAILLSSLTLASAFAGYECDVQLAKTKAPTKVLGTVSLSQPTGADSAANWGRLVTEKTAKDGTVTAIELGGWVDATRGIEGAKFSVYRNIYSGETRTSEDFLLPVQIDGTYVRQVELESYVIRFDCRVN